MSANGFLGAGDVMINVIEGNAYQGWKGPYPADQFEIKANSELKESISKGRNTYGQVDESVSIPQPFDLNITLKRLDSSGLALALMGTAAAANQTSGTLTDEAVVMKADTWSPLSKANFPGALTVENTAGTVTHVEGVDYIVNRQLGWIQPITGGAIVDGTSVNVSGAYAAITATKIRGATKKAIRCAIKFDGINLADELPTIVTVHEAVINSQAAIDFLSSDFGTVPLTGRMKTPAGKTEPFDIEQRDTV